MNNNIYENDEINKIYSLFEQTIKTAKSMSKAIIELYDKIDILNKRIEDLERERKTE